MANANPNPWEADKMLDVYICDYFKKRKLDATAKAFLEEAKVPTDPVAIEAPGGFLFEWWSVFWDIFIAMSAEKKSDAAASYIETQVIKAQELQQQQNFQNPQPQQQPNQIQMQQLLLQRHAQQQQQRKDGSPNHVGDPCGFLDTLRRQTSGTPSIPTPKIHEDRLRAPLRRGSMGYESPRYEETIGQISDSKHVSSLKLDATGAQAQRETLRGTTGGNTQRVQNRSPPLPMLDQIMKNKMSPPLHARSAMDGQEASLLGAHGSNQAGINLTLNGWPLTGLDQLRSGLQQQQQQRSLPPHLQQQLLLQAQNNMISPSAESRKMRMLFNRQNALGRDGSLSFIGDLVPSINSPMHTIDVDLLHKASQLQQLQMQSQLPIQLARNSDQNQLDKMISSSMMDGCIPNNSQKMNQASKIQQTRKRKQSMLSSGPTDASALNTTEPSSSPRPSTPAHTTGETMEMQFLSKNGGSFKPPLMVASDDMDTLPSAPNELADLDRSVLDGPLEDNVESFLSPEEDDTADKHVSDNEAFAFVEHKTIPVGTELQCCAFSSNGKLLATGGMDNKVVLWCMDSFTVTATLEEHTLMITDVRFSPTMRRLATSSADQTIRVWDAANPSYSLRTFTGHSAAVTSLDFHPCKDDLVYSADATGEIRCWSINNGSCAKVVQAGVTRIRFQPCHGRFFAGTSENTVSILDSETQACKLKLQGHKNPVADLCWDFTGEYLASVSEDMARVWSFSPGGNGECIHEVTSSGSEFRSCSFHPTYSFLLVIGCDKKLELWNTAENKMMTIEAHEDIISRLASSKKTRMAVSVSPDGYAKLWK